MKTNLFTARDTKTGRIEYVTAACAQDAWVCAKRELGFRPCTLRVAMALPLAK